VTENVGGVSGQLCASAGVGAEGGVLRLKEALGLGPASRCCRVAWYVWGKWGAALG
jgi:hypothetical protein